MASVLSHTAEHTETPLPDVGGLGFDDFAIHRQLEEVAETQGNTTEKDFCRRGCESSGGKRIASDAYYPLRTAPGREQLRCG